ncbi:MAG: hypothetical protein IJJ31_01910 [Mogibacterium sp.]|nr:hypothetical protein [Mogibacterium sp.]
MRKNGKRRVWLYQFIAIFAAVMLLNSCGGSSESASVQKQEPQSEPQQTAEPEVDYYAIYQDTINMYDCYALVDLNDDDVPELLVTDEDNANYPGIYDDFDKPHAFSAEVYTINHGTVMDIGDISAFSDGYSEIVYDAGSRCVYMYDSDFNDNEFLSTYYVDDYPYDDNDNNVLLVDRLYSQITGDPEYDMRRLLRHNVTNGAGNYEEQDLSKAEFDTKYRDWMKKYENIQPLEFDTVDGDFDDKEHFDSEEIYWDEAYLHIGETVTVTGPVVSVDYGNLTFISIGTEDEGRFLATIWHGDIKERGYYQEGSDLDHIKGKEVQIYGTIEEYSDGTPMIDLSDPESQLYY